MIAAEAERARPGSGEAFADAVAFSFGDAGAELYGSARLGHSPASGKVSALALLFAGGEPVAATARGGIATAGVDWTLAEAGGVRCGIDEPLRRWTVAFEGEDAAFEARFEALADPFELAGDGPVARAGGQEGYVHLCGVEASVTIGGRRRELRCLGQREHAWGAPDWDRLDRAASLSAWLDDDRAVVVQTVRPAGALGHEQEAVTAGLLDAGEDGPVPRTIADPRLSVTYDAEGRQRRAGLELWVGEDDEVPRRAGGEVRCGTTLDLGRLRLDAAFFAWHMEGREGVGRFDLLHRVR